MTNFLGPYSREQSHINPPDFLHQLSQLVPTKEASRSLNAEEKKACSDKISTILKQVLASLDHSDKIPPNFIPRFKEFTEKVESTGLLSKEGKLVVSNIAQSVRAKGSLRDRGKDTTKDCR